MTSVWVLDCETTGTDPDRDKVVEVAGVLLRDCMPVGQFQCLVDPGVPIPPQASAVHHLTDRHVEGQASLDEALRPVRENPADYYAAHNAAFDSSFLGLDDRPWVCTWKCSLRVFLDAPSHSNQVLRYWLGLADPVMGGHAHRALYDAEVTAQLLARLVERSVSDDPYPRMAELSSQPALMRRVSFGKHRDELWSDLPTDYLQWILSKSSGWDENQLFTARYWLERRRAA